MSVGILKHSSLCVFWDKKGSREGSRAQNQAAKIRGMVGVP